ncbi:hypothetical protein [Bacillus sp. REN3]|uniref:hypothetical protein n=1 Tax=Bacillus sp. REN3 TaxID=2802440 RepID=UPI001AEE6ACA|nr:hypothetical protein [Bacillus sp. REN3]
MSLKHYAVLLKFAGLIAFLVPLFLRGMDAHVGLSQTGVIIVISIGTVLLITGNVMEAKALRTDEKLNGHR